LGGRSPRLPAGLRIYAIGDIHGRLDLLDKLLELVKCDLALHPAVRPVYLFLGDYIDRGPASRATIDRLIAHGDANEVIFLRGNHEQIALKCLSDRALFDKWLRLGGWETLLSYGVSCRNSSHVEQIVELQTSFHGALPQTHFRFFRNLQNSFTCGDYFFAHAGVRPGIALASQTEADLLWIRHEFLASRSNFGKIIVHGHTPASEIEVASNRINIDTGAFATGRLTCLVIEDGLLSVITAAIE
jgi:serine/threonine protein phosphatase 1